MNLFIVPEHERGNGTNMRSSQPQVLAAQTLPRRSKLTSLPREGGLLLVTAVA